MKGVARFFALSLLWVQAQAYELGTHTRVTEQAWRQSTLSDPAFVARLGLSDVPDGLPLHYYDMGSFLARRVGTQHEADQMPGGLRLYGNRRVVGWLMRGSVREDDLEYVGFQRWSLLKRRNHDPDPFGEMFRLCNHFYDPFRNRGMEVPDGSLVDVACGPGPQHRRPAVQWATGAATPHSPNGIPIANYRNHFTIYSAKEAMWRALTLTEGNGTRIVPSDLTSAEIRGRSWATTFRALGGAVHLVQDMAQPQHARNEPHLPFSVASWYETYAEQRAKEEEVDTIDVATRTITGSRFAPSLTPDLSQEYPIPRFLTYGNYFGQANGPGMATYSNQGFLTVNHAFQPGNEYPLPNRNPAAYAELPVAHPRLDCAGVLDNGTVVTYLTASVPDAFLTQPSPAIRMIAATGRPNQYAPNGCVFDDHLSLLLPRAVAYSAGLLNHFFRGRLAISLPADGVYAIVDHKRDEPGDPAFTRVRMKVRNETPPLGEHPEQPQVMVGKLVAVAKYRTNTCYDATLAGEWGSQEMKSSKGDVVFKGPENGGCRGQELISISEIHPNVTLEPNTDYAYEFNFQNDRIPVNATDLHLQVVFRGQLGQEDDAVVVETKDIGEPAFTAFSNGTNYLFCHGVDFHYWTEDGQFPPALVGTVPNYETYQAGPIQNLKIAFGGNLPGVRPLVEVAALPLRSYVRFAWLGDLDKRFDTSFEYAGSSYANSYGFTPNQFRSYTNQVTLSYSGAGPIIDADSRATNVRGVMHHRSAFGRFFHLQSEVPCTASLPIGDRYTPGAFLPVSLLPTSLL